MYFNRKLKPIELSLEHFTGVAVGIVFALVATTFGFSSGFIVIFLFGLSMSTLTFLVVIKTKNISYLALTAMFIFIALLGFSIFVYGYRPRNDIKILLSVLVLFSTGTVVILVITRKLKWKTREILELAALPVEDVSDGFTERPKPIGVATFSKHQLDGFGRFLMKHLLAIVYWENERMVISLDNTLKKQIGLSSDYSQSTTITINYNGDITVFITQKDYMKYRYSFSYDQLCQSMGNLFIEFLELYKKGEGKRIIEKCDNLGLNPYIE